MMKTGSPPTHSSPIFKPQYVLAYPLVLQMYGMRNKSKTVPLAHIYAKCLLYLFESENCVSCIKK